MWSCDAMAKILLIEDDDIFREAVRLWLTAWGHDVTPSSNGRHALATFDSAPCPLVITDVIMPERDGLELVPTFRQRHPQVKIIAMSGGGWIAGDDCLRMAKMLGADRVIAKPFTPQELAALIKELDVQDDPKNV